VNPLKTVGVIHWKVKVLKKQDASLPYEFNTHELHKRARIIARYKGKLDAVTTYNSYGRVEASHVLPFAAIIKSDSATDDLAVKRFKRHLSSEIGYFNAAVPIGELKELHKSCEGIVNSISRVFDKLEFKYKRGKKLSPMSLLSYTADAWIQWSFGINPLVNTVIDANKALDAWFQQRNHMYKVKAGAMFEYLTRTSGQTFPGPYQTNFTLKVHGSHKYFVKLTGEFDLKVESSVDYSMADRFSINFQGLYTTLYELTPFSWLIDYLTTLGDVINDDPVISPGATLWLNKTVTVRSRYETNFIEQFTVLPGSPTYPVSRIVTREPGLEHAVYMKRTPLTSIPARTLRIKTLQELQSHGWSKLANLAAVYRLITEHERVKLTPSEQRRIRALYSR